jgi:hypothetical protein
MPMISVVPIERLELLVEPHAWRFAAERRDEIAAHFAARKAATPQLFNGRTLMTRAYRLAGGRLAGAMFETGYADFLAWRDWGFADPHVTNCFSMGALRSADGAFLLGVMGPDTANAGRVYFPAGMLDPSDVRNGTVDLFANLLRETAEETGRTTADFVPRGWYAGPAGARLAVMRVLETHEDAETLRARIRAHLDAEAKPELADSRVVRGPADLDPMMPDFVAAFLAHLWGTK